MKTLFAIVLTGLMALSARAQFVQGPSRFNMLTNTGTWMNVSSNGGTVAANFPLTQAPWIPVGGNGFGIALKGFATNAALTTNIFFTIEFSADGVNAITNTTATVVFLPTGVATNTYYTNFPIATSVTLGNIAAARLKNIMSTNGVVGGSLAGNMFFERIYLNTR